MLEKIKSDLSEFAVAQKIEVCQSFFKTGEGQYGEGDVFIGVSVPNVRKVAKRYRNVSLELIEELLISEIHEERLLGVLILVEKYELDNDDVVAEFYLKKAEKINNWDLVDLSAHKIVGHYYFKRSREPLYELARSKNLWKRRISVVATFYFIRKGEFRDTLKIVEMLFGDGHDLIQKAGGWMLREVGKREVETLENFLKKHYKKMPRTMLRYAIERFPEEKRLDYLKGRV